MAFTLNRRLAQLVNSSGQLNTGKIPNDYISSDHIADNVITTAMLHSGFTLPTGLTPTFGNTTVGSRLTFSSNSHYLETGTNAVSIKNGSGTVYLIATNSGTTINNGLTVNSNITTTGYLAGPSTFTIDPAAVGDNTGTVVIAGNLQVDGTTTTINSTTVTVDDLNITLASGAANAGAANGAGITVDGASATITYDGTNDEWDFNKPINVTGRIVGTGISQFANVNIPNNNAIRFGNSQQLQIYHDGTNGSIQATSGEIFLYGGGDHIRIRPTNNQESILAHPAGQVELYHAGNIKLATTSSGVNITGSLDTSGSVTMNNSVASGSFLTDATIYPLRLTNDDTTAGNAVAMTFGQGGFDFTNFIASVRTGTGNDPKGDLVFGGRPSDGSAFVERMRIQADGDVGIGTNNPLMKLDVRGGNIQLGGYGGGGDYGLVLTPSDSSSYWHIYNDAGGELVFGRNITVGSTEYARFDSTGKLGLGVNNPQHQLDISDTISAKIQLSGGTNQNGIKFVAAGDGGVSSSNYYLGVGSDLMSSTDYGAVLLDVTNNRAVLLDDQSNSRLTLHGNKLAIDNTGNVGIGILSPTLVTGKIVHIHGGAAGVHLTDTASGTTSGDGAYFVFDNPNLYIQQKEAGPMIFETSGTERMRIADDGYVTFTSTRSGYAMELNSAGTRAGLVLNKPGTSTVMGSLLMMSNEEYRLGTASHYHINMNQAGKTWFGDNTRYGHFDENGNLNFEHGGVINFEAASNDYSTVYSATGYASQGYSASQRYWNHMISKGGTHITVNSDGGHTGSENNYDDFVVWQGSPDTAEPLFRVSNTGRVIAKQNYEIGNHKTNREEFGVNAINTVDTATSDINTTVTNTYENRSGVYWLNFNSKRFRAFIRPQWLQGRNWVLAAKFFAFNDMPSGSVLWTNDASWNGGDFDLNNGHFSKYGKVWRYFGFNRLAMQMGNRIAPIMQFSSTQTLYGAFSGGYAANGGGVSPSSTDPALSTGATYHGMTNYMGPAFTDLGGLEDKMQSYGLNKWANAAINSTSANNNGSADLNSNVSKGFQLTVEDAHKHVAGNDSLGRAGAWIGCPLDEGNCNPLATSSNAGADSGFGFGGGCGNTARTWTSGIAEWARGNEVANYHPAYIWLSID